MTATYDRHQTTLDIPPEYPEDRDIPPTEEDVDRAFYTASQRLAKTQAEVEIFDWLDFEFSSETPSPEARCAAEQMRIAEHR